MTESAVDEKPELEVSFRFLDLSDDDARALESLPVDMTFRPHHKTGAGIGSVRLDSESVQHILKFVEERRIDAKETDIFLSLATDYDSLILAVPRAVNEIVKVLDSELTYSFTYVDAL